MFMMERKISDRTYTENTRNYVDLCKAALANDSVSSTVKSTCINSLLRPEHGAGITQIKEGPTGAEIEK
jgi:hypothetical protein